MSLLGAVQVLREVLCSTYCICLKYFITDFTADVVVAVIVLAAVAVFVVGGGVDTVPRSWLFAIFLSFFSFFFFSFFFSTRDLDV